MAIEVRHGPNPAAVMTTAFGSGQDKTRQQMEMNRIQGMQQREADQRRQEEMSRQHQRQLELVGGAQDFQRELRAGDRDHQEGLLGRQRALQLEDRDYQEKRELGDRDYREKLAKAKTEEERNRIKEDQAFRTKMAEEEHARRQEAITGAEERGEARLTREQEAEIERQRGARAYVEQSDDYTDEEKAEIIRGIDEKIHGITPPPRSPHQKDAEEPRDPQGRAAGEIYVDENSGATMQVQKDARGNLFTKLLQPNRYDITAPDFARFDAEARKQATTRDEDGREVIDYDAHERYRDSAIEAYHDAQRRAAEMARSDQPGAQGQESTSPQEEATDGLQPAPDQTPEEFNAEVTGELDPVSEAHADEVAATEAAHAGQKPGESLDEFVTRDVERLEREYADEVAATEAAREEKRRKAEKSVKTTTPEERNREHAHQNKITRLRNVRDRMSPETQEHLDVALKSLTSAQRGDFQTSEEIKHAITALDLVIKSKEYQHLRQQEHDEATRRARRERGGR